MKIRPCAALILTLAVAGGTAVDAAEAAEKAVLAQAAGRCPEGHPESGDLGIRSLLCVSGSCAVNTWNGHGYAHEFSTEPRVRGLEDGGPADGKLRDGDILITIDGVLITTREGGRRMANLKPGVPVTLRIRRDGREMDVTLIPRLGCNMPGLAVMAGAAPMARPVVATKTAQTARPVLATAPAVAAHPSPEVRAVLAASLAEPPFNFGLELECGDCGWRPGPGSTVLWLSATHPKVLAVETGGPGDQAGLKPGDVLLELDGHPLDREESGRAIGKLHPGEAVSLTFRRGSETRTVTMTPRANTPAHRF